MTITGLRIFRYGEFIDIKIGQKFTVARCGSGHTVFGELATLTRITDSQLIFTTESGSIVRANHNLQTIGKAKREDYFVSTRLPETYGEDFINSRISYWNPKTLKLEHK